MRLLVLAIISAPLWATVTQVQVIGATRQQIVISFSVPDPTQCLVRAYEDSAATIPVDDTNNTVFGNASSCNRAGSIVDGHRVTAIIGKRTSEMALDGRLHSRSLQVATAYYVKIDDLSDSSVASAVGTTSNIPWGDTHVEDVPFNAAGYNNWAYPTLDWSDAGQNTKYTDPLSGVQINRLVRQMYGEGGLGDNPGYEWSFTDVLDLNSKWSNPSNAKNTSVSGPFASYTGNARDPLFIPFPSSGNGYLKSWDNNFATMEDAQLNLFGSAISTGTAADAMVSVALCVNFNPSVNNCSPEIDVPLSTGAATEVKASSLYPKFYYAGWNIGRIPTNEEMSVPNGNATVTASAVTLSSGYLPMSVAVGMKINIAGTWYTIGTLKTATTFNLVEPAVTTSGPWYMGTLGFRVRKKTATNNTINIAATYSLVYGYNPGQPAGGTPVCSPLTFSVGYAADGTTALNPPKTGRLCTLVATAAPDMVLALVTSDGETRYLSNLTHYVSGNTPTIPMGSFNTTDPYSLWAAGPDDTNPASGNTVFYKVTYDYANTACRFKQWNGNGYLRRNDGDPCMIWTNRNPTAEGNTATQQIAAVIGSNPIWDIAQMRSINFLFNGVSGNYAVFYQSSHGQNTPSFMAVFDLRTSTLIKTFDTFSGTLNGFRWGGSHSNGIDQGGTTNIASFSASYLPRDSTGWLSGPFYLPPVVAKSLDGATWTSNTALYSGTLVSLGNNPLCGANPVVPPPGVYNFGSGQVFNITGSQCVDINSNPVAGACAANSFGVPVGSQQCVWLKISTDYPCNATASGVDSGKWPCPWTSGSMGGSSWSAPQALQAGDVFAAQDSFAGDLPVNPERMRVLTKTWDGTNWVLMVQRWAYNDNLYSSPNLAPPAVAYFDHLFTGSFGSIHANGWIPWMLPGGGGGTIVFDLSTPTAAATPWKGDTLGSHAAGGLAPDGIQTVAVSPAGARTGKQPEVEATPLSHSLDIYHSTFAGISLPSSEGLIEQYPNISNAASPTVASRSLYWDWRHVNPNFGTSPENPVRIWNHAYTPVSGQNITYKMDIFSPLNDHKSRRPNVFSTRSAFYDISGPGSVINDSKPFAYCYVYVAGECASNSVANELYVVAPNAHIGFGGCTTNTLKFYTPCATSLWHYAAWMVEGSTQEDDTTASHIRRITMGFSGPGAQYEYTSPQMIPDSSQALMRPSYSQGVRPDMLLVKMPPPAPVDSVDRSQYIAVPVSLPAGSGYARVRFGYSENGAATQFYCTSRREACLTDAKQVPFAFATTESLTATDCRGGCSINVPALSGRVLYYRVERSLDGLTKWMNSVTQVLAIQ